MPGDGARIFQRLGPQEALNVQIVTSVQRPG